MKKYIVSISFYGLTGEYLSHVDVDAKTPRSAQKKAERVIGNRDGQVVSVKEAM